MDRPDFVEFTPATGPVFLQDLVNKRVKRCFFTMRVRDLINLTVPKDPNPRSQNTSSKVAKGIKTSLHDPLETAFHLRNRGLLLVARNLVELSNGKLRINFKMENEDGTMTKLGMGDGATTYESCRDTLEEAADMAEVAGEKFVTIETIYNLPDEIDAPLNKIVTKVVCSRNNNIAVTPGSRIDQEGGYDAFKEVLAASGFGDRIGYRQNDAGIRIEDILTMMSLLNPVVPLKDGRECQGPNMFGSNVLPTFEQHQESYYRMANILEEILMLFDHIGAELGKLYNNNGENRAGGMLIFSAKTPYGESVTPFKRLAPTGSSGSSKVFPIKDVWFACLGACRSLVEVKRGGKEIGWKMPFEKVLEMFDRVAKDMVVKAQIEFNVSKKSGASVGREWPIWEKLHLVMERQVERQLGR